jgi:nitrite reductase/ring-hydroxylating ferredoxin subunit
MNLPPTFARSDRRQFIKHFALSTALSFIGGKLWTARLLADVDPSLAVGRIAIKLSDYPVFANSFGSVRFAFADPAGGRYPFVLTRGDGDEFYAVDTRCAHMNCIVEAYSDGLTAMVCECHGSEYNYRGEVTNPPATTNLLQYVAEYDGDDTVTVFIPGIDMRIADVAVQSNNGATIRVRLKFPTIDFARYRVQFRQELADEPQDTLLSTSPAIAPNLPEVTGNGQEMTVYADAALPRGFFSVALMVDPY